jgi:conflict system pore-forming effector with SLATT domain
VTATTSAKAHELSEQSYDKKNKMLGIPATAISVVVGSSIFATLASDNKNVWIMAITGSLSIGAAVLSAVQTFLKYTDIAQSHKIASGEYRVIMGNVDMFC